MLNLMKKYNNREDGFTLIELLIVVLIIGILAAIAIPVYIGIQNQAHKSAVKADVSSAVVTVQVALTEGQSLASQIATKAGSDKGETVQVKASTTTGATANDFMVIGTETATTGAVDYTYTYDSVTGAFTSSDDSIALGGSGSTAPSTSAPTSTTIYTLTGETGDSTNSLWSFTSASFSTAQANTGSRSVYITGAASVDLSALTSGKSYTVTAWMYNVNNPATSKGVNMVVYSSTSPSTVVAGQARTTASGSWQQITYTFTAGTGAKLNFGSYFSGSGYIDDVVVTQNN